MHNPHAPRPHAPRPYTPRADDADLRRTFGGRVREHRVRRGLSQEHLADLAGLDRTYVSGVERGRRNLSLRNICRLAAALGIDPAVLVTGLAPTNEGLGG